VVFTSSTVDVAANMELLRETAELCNRILEHTGWQIRLLSKSHLLPKLVADGMIPEQYHHRLIFGFSTGTVDDRVARAIEKGTALVSKRIESLQWLQDNGFRTFGMICPSLPQEDYRRFSEDACEAIRVDRCEHVWAEPINVRGESLLKTLAALKAAGLDVEAKRLAAVSGAGHSKAWEEYARQTFLAHARNIPPQKLRFLQYIDGKTADWWAKQRKHGAVLLGKTAKAMGLTVI
jgi:DNA repair photolyase